MVLVVGGWGGVGDGSKDVKKKEIMISQNS